MRFIRLSGFVRLINPLALNRLMFLVVLGLIDIIIGIVLALSGVVKFTGSSLVFYIAVIAIIKGIYSILAAMAGRFYFDFLGVLDLLSGIFLYFATTGTVLSFFLYVGIIMIIKGFYSTIMGMVGRN